MASAPPAAPVAPGVILEYVASGGGRRLGHALRPDGKKNWVVEDAAGACQSVAPKQILFVYGALADVAGSAPPAEKLALTESACARRVEENRELLEVAWEIVATRDAEDGGTTTTLDEVADLVFDDRSAESMYAAHVLLEEDKIFFKKKIIKGGAQYDAKPENLVSESRVALLANQQREREEVELANTIRQSVHGADPAPLRSLVGEERYGVFVSALEAIAEDFGSNVRAAGYAENAASGFSALDSDMKAAAKLVLGALKLPVVPQSAFDVLVAWKVFVRHENLAFRRAGLHRTIDFSPSLLDMARTLNEADSSTIEDLDAKVRRDLTHLVCYAIDSSDTDEIDDAISWDASSNLVWVHVADPTRFFPECLENPLVSDALRRATTLYLPTKRYTMFPTDLAAGKLSLGSAQSDRCALSFGFRLQDDGEIDAAHTVITTSYIGELVRLTYEEVDAILSQGDSSHNLCILSDVAERRAKFREEDGALIVPSPFSRVKVLNADAEDPEIRVSVLESDTKAWNLVSEMMIAASGIAGDRGAKGNIPFPYRGQEPFDVPSEEVIQDIPAGPARNSAYFRGATPSEVRLEPMVHASLALDAYVQVTSPIRRGVDMLAHFQLKSIIRGDPPLLGFDEMKAEIGRNAEANRVMRMVDQNTTKYWHLEYLRRKGPNVAHDAIYVRPLRDSDNRLGLVYLTESGFQLVANLPTGSEPGVRLAVKVISAEPRSLFSRTEATLLPGSDTKLSDNDVLELFSVIDSEEDEPASAD